MMKNSLLGVLKVTMTVTVALLLGCGIAGTFEPCSVSAASGVYGDYEYNVLGDGTVEISKYNGLDSSVIIPDTIDGKTVTSIGVGAFSYDYDDSIKSITIPDSVTSIKTSAFESCTALTKINIPSKIKNIEEAVFKDCDSLENVTIPYGVTEIGDAAFESSGIKSLDIPDSVTVIGEKAFYLSSLNKVTLSKNLEEIKGWAFQNTPITSITIPEGLKTISRGGFQNCGNLTDVSLPNGLTEIYEEAFKDCQGLKQIVIPDSVKEIHSSAFENCCFLERISLPQTITEIADRMFYGCASLKKVVIPDTVTKIGDNAFCLCVALNDINMPSVLNSLGDSAFAGCQKLSALTLPDSVEEVGSFALSATNISNINFPKNLNIVGENPFSETPYAKNIENTDGNGGLYWQNWLVSYDDNADFVSIKAGTEHIADAVFMESHTGGTLALPDGIKTIGERAFLSSDFTEVTIPDSVIKIGRFAFDQCLSLEKVNLSKSLVSIGEGTFSQCYRLKNIEIPETVTYVGALAFFESGIVREQTDSSIKYVGDWIVGIDSVPSELNIRDGVVGIAENVFFGAVLSKVTIPKSVKYIAPHSFNNQYGNLKIYCYLGSAAEEYAKNNQIAYELLDTCTDGHTEQNNITKATTKSDGGIVTKCSVCGKVLSETVIKKISNISLSAISYTYNGKVKTPQAVVKNSDGKTLEQGTDYTVIYADGRKNVGVYVVTIEFKGNYSGTVEKNFTINPKTTNITKLKPGRKKFNVKWKKQDTQTTGYQIQYSTSSKFKMAKTVVISNNKTTGKAVSKLVAKKKYYVRICTYKVVKVNGKAARLYSSWSKALAVKVK